jgi:PQQ-dependent dehydrogenase (s-GDH family)
MKKITLFLNKTTFSVLLSLIGVLCYSQTTYTFTTTSTFIPPAGVTSVTAEAWGGGGAGGGVTGNNLAGGGGTGGGYVKNNTLSVVANSSYNITVGAVKSGTTGGSQAGNPSSMALSSTPTTYLMYATGGNGGGNAAVSNGAGGSAVTTGNIGGSTTNSYGTAGTSGGASGGNGSASAFAYDATNTGAGGIGSSTAGDGQAGKLYGGGGAGARRGTSTNRLGGNGAAGAMKVSWTCPTYSLNSTAIISPTCINNGATVNVTSSTANLPIGTYTVVYTLTGANTATASATMTVTTAGTGSFTTNTVTNAGTTIVTITNLLSGSHSPCNSTITTNNTANLILASTATPSITSTTNATGSGTAAVILKATASSGATISWYAAASGGSSLYTGTDFTTPLISTTTTYYAEASNGTCTSSPRTAVTAIFGAALDVFGNSKIISNGDISPSIEDFTDFGSIPTNSKFSRTFVLKNTGTSTLSFPTAATSVVLSGTNSDQFSITTSVIINPRDLTANTYTTIEISFNPTSTGFKTATLTIDPSNGFPAAYSFTIQGTATPTATSDFVMTKVTPNNTFNYPYALLYGSDNFLWLTERVGKKINRVDPSTGAVDLLINLSTEVYCTGGQDGLMSMIFDPNFATNNYVYVAYTYSIDATDTGRRTKIVRYTYSITGNDGSLASPYTLIEGLAGSNDHNSGKLKIGPDNKLYYTIGDNGANQFANWCKEIQAQTLPTQAEVDAANYTTAYQGKILRMNLDGSIPSDNPVIKGIRSHIYSYGHRNPQGLVFGKNGKLYSSEHGPKSDDEINIITSGGNYGWPFIAGFKDGKNYAYCNWSTSTLTPRCQSNLFSDYTCGAGATSTTELSWSGTSIDPIATFFTIDDGYNFTGGYLSWPTIAPSSTTIYESYDNQIPGWDNSLLTTTLKKGELYRQKLSPDGSTILGVGEPLLYTQNRYRDVAIAPDGKTLYIITDSGGATSGPSGSQQLSVQDPGVILKFEYQPSLVPCSTPIPDVTTLPTITDNCAVTLTAPTATNNCSGTGGIVGLTDTVFPITAQGDTTVIWTYKYGNGLTVTQNQTVTINSTTWDGNSWNNGEPTAAQGAIIAANYTIATNLSICSLTIKDNAVVTVNTGINLNIAGDLKIETGSSLTFESNSNLVQSKEINGNTGNAIIKRQTSNLKFLDYVLWSSPVASQQLLSFSPATLTTRFYTYNTSTNLYNLVASPSTTNFGTATGYLIRMPNNHPTAATIWEGQFQGVPNNGNMSLNVAYDKYNAIGNPYPSTISANTFIDTNYITEALYFWRKTNNAASSSYATYTKAGGTANNGDSNSIIPNGTIQVGQGFIYKATSATLTFTNAMRTANTSNQFLKTSEKTKTSDEKSRIWLNLSKNNEPVNQMMIAYMDGATAGIDPAIDGRYFNDNKTALNSLVEDQEFVIQGRSPFENTDVVPLAFKAATGGNFAIEIDHVDGLFSSSQDIILKDNLTGAETDLKTSTYTFTASAGTDNTRFSLKYQKTLGIIAPEFNENSIVVYKNKGTIHIKSEAEPIESVKIYDIKGSLLFEKTKVNANETNIESSKFAHQVLIVQITSEDKKVVKKKVVN